MKRLQKILGFACVVLLVPAFLIPHVAEAQALGIVIGRAVSVQGRIEVRRAGQAQWEAVRPKDPFQPGDVVRVGPLSRADIALVSDTVIRIDQNTTLTFSEPERQGLNVLNLLRGAFYFLTNRPRSLKVSTPFVNGYVEGTEFYTRVEAEQVLVSMFKGQVTLSNQVGSLTIREGESAVAVPNRAPEIRAVVSPRDAVKWTLYYPPVLSCAASEFQTGQGPGWQDVARNAFELSEKGNLDGALEGLSAVHDGVSDPRFFICRASLFFAVGRVDEAASDLGRALANNPRYAPALAMEAVLALIVNDGERARLNAARAMEADPKSVTTWIALSYIRQGGFDLPGALEAARKATEVDPGNGLAWARLSELRLSFGDTEGALASAEKAAAATPRSARSYTVLGFTRLKEVETGAAQDAFHTAIELDQADPLARLGLGLSLIKEGKLTEGREQIEIAASLDPSNSLVRSYLGKAYYEEKRSDQASGQFAMAKKLDPSDPTPHLYDAILKQGLNRPVEALEDLQKSVELNDRRAVYRSRLLLDEDLAVRSVSLARIYSDLGFGQRALAEGWKSANLDPANYSAHRFLADSYSALPRREIARVSELLQSQLLQPININPVQPSLAESSALIPAIGYSDPSFSEYTPLFNRNRLALLAGGLAGENGTWGQEVIQSGLWDRWSYSIGQLHQETDGFRTNSDISSNIANLFGQVQVSSRTSMQVELRTATTTFGDIELRFYPWDYRPALRQKEESDSARFGFHHSFAPGSDLIASVTYRHSEPRLRDHDPLSPYFQDTKEDGFISEMQYLYRREHINLVCGAGYAAVDRQDSVTMGQFIDPVFVAAWQNDGSIYHTNLYIYSQINYPKSLILTLGGSGDFVRGLSMEKDRFNPKLGVTWNPFPSTTIRGAVFRTLKRTLITSQTVEPTQVAGFNQFFDDAEGTQSWTYGAALDQKLSANLFGGAEYSQRDLRVPFELGPSVTSVDWKERTGRAYLYWTPHRWFALTGEYLYEKFDRDREFGAGVEEVRTHRVPLGLSFFHPLGLIGKMQGTYVDQSGRFRPQFVLMPWQPSLRGTSSFWVFDASLGYRLPLRYGMVTAGVKNLFDKSFKYQDMDPVNPRIQPDRFIYARLTLSF